MVTTMPAVAPYARPAHAPGEIAPQARPTVGRSAKGVSSPAAIAMVQPLVLTAPIAATSGSISRL
jgi:hypothetical protein